MKKFKRMFSFLGGPSMIVLKEMDIFKAKAEFDGILTMVQEAAQAGTRIDLVEQDLWTRLLRLGLTTLVGFIHAQGTGDLGFTLPFEGRELKRLKGLYHRRYVSVFGELSIGRTAYGSRPTQKLQVLPLDSRLGLPDSDFSHLLQDWDQSFCVQGSYAQSRHTVERILGLGQTVGSLETMNQSMAQEVSGFFEQQPAPPPAPEGSMIVLTADHKGVKMRRNVQEDGPAPKGRLKKGQKPSKKKMACVGGVYTIEPFVRTAQDVVNEVMRHKKQTQRPKPKDKRLRAELTQRVEGEEIKGTEVIFPWFEQEITKRNPQGRHPVVCVMDGERKLWRILKSMFPSVVCILDLYHVLERLWAIAYCFYPESSKEAQTFVTTRLERLLEGNVGYVIGGIKQMGVKNKLNKNKREKLDAAITYLENNRRFMKYDEYLSAGYPIGSGVVEGACRHVVKDRMEQTGMHWRIPGAQSILHLRALYLNGDWETFQEYRIEQECQRLYPYKEPVDAAWPNVQDKAA
jgi:hypothetical protein